MTKAPPPPGSLDLFVEVLGLDDTLRLIEAHGGTTLWIPKGVDSNSDAPRQRLEAQFGAAMTKAMIRTWGGDFLKVPLCRAWRTLLYHSRGLSHKEIARLVGCHSDTVWRRLRRLEGDRGQFSLGF